MFRRWLICTGVSFKRGSVNPYIHTKLKQKRVKTHGGDVVRVQVPEVGHVIVGVDLGTGVLPLEVGDGRHEHVLPWGLGPHEPLLHGFYLF